MRFCKSTYKNSGPIKEYVFFSDKTNAEENGGSKKGAWIGYID